MDGLRRVNELPQIYASYHEIEAKGEAEVIAEHLIKRYFRSIPGPLVYEDEIERRHYEGVACYRVR